MKLADELKRIRIDLGDVRKSRFTDEQLLFDLNTALCETWVQRPDLFATTKAIQLKAGDLQSDENCCRILSVDAIVDANGKIIASVTTANEDDPAPFKKASCLRGNAALAQTYTASLSEQPAGEFTITPYLPTGIKAWARVRQSCPPKSFTLEDLNVEVDERLWCEIRLPIHEFFLALARRSAPRSASDVAMAKGDLQLFGALLATRNGKSRKARAATGDGGSAA
jgi:hypothetical protein